MKQWIVQHKRLTKKEWWIQCLTTNEWRIQHQRLSASRFHGNGMKRYLLTRLWYKKWLKSETHLVTARKTTGVSNAKWLIIWIWCVLNWKILQNLTNHDKGLTEWKWISGPGPINNCSRKCIWGRRNKWLQIYLSVEEISEQVCGSMVF